MELIDVTKRRRVSVACLQETKWKGNKTKELANGYKFFYAGKNTTRNGVSIVIGKDLKEKIIEVKRLGDRIIAIKLVLEEDMIHIISVYAPQAGLHKSVKSQFWEDLDGLLREIPTSEKIFLRGDLNGHVGKDKIEDMKACMKDKDLEKRTS